MGPPHQHTTSALRQVMRFQGKSRPARCCRDGRSIAASTCKADPPLTLRMELTTSPESAARDPFWVAPANSGLWLEIRAISILEKRPRLLATRLRAALLPATPTAYGSQ